METVEFQADLPALTAPPRDFVYRTGKVFECGAYPDKGFSLTPEEAAAAVADFSPCFADLEHRNTVLDGKMGELESVKLHEDGKTLIGVVKEPKWLSDVMGNEPRKVSLTWDKITKRIKGIAHVLSPRVSDAAVFSAYANFSAQPIPQEPVEEEISPKETSFMKVFIPNANGSKSGTPEEVAQFCGGTIGADTRGLLIQSEEGAMRKATPEEIVTFTGGQVKFAAPEATLSPDVQARLDRLAQFEAAEKQQSVGLIATQAQAKYAALAGEKKIAPAEKESFITAFTVALRYDSEREGLAFFSAEAPEAKFSLADYLAQIHDARNSNTLFEAVPRPNASFSAHAEKPSNDGVDQAARKAALQAIPAGQNALKTGAITISE